MPWILHGTKAEKGFSLVELSIALGLIGLFVGVCLQVSRIDRHQRLIAALAPAMPEGNVDIALQRFILRHRRFPCPADPALPENHPNAGIEFCAVDMPMPAGQVTVCNTPPGGSPGTGGLCRALGTTNVNSGGTYDGPDSVLIGSLPYTTLGLLPQETYDGWGMKFGYAVTRGLTVPPTPGNPLPDEGSITLIDINGYAAQSTYTGMEIIPNPDFAANQHMFVVWSYGSGKRGAYTSDGKKPFACDPVPVAPWSPLSGAAYQNPYSPLLEVSDNYNCDNDSTFLYDFYGSGNKFAPHIRSLRPGPNFYDSYILLWMPQECSELWCRVNLLNGDARIGDNSTYIGVNTDNPQHPLDVNGTVRVPKTIAQKYCDSNGYDCFGSQLIGGDGSNACWGEAVAGIAYGEIKCPDRVPAGAVPDNRTCPTGRFISGLNASGELQCKTYP